MPLRHLREPRIDRDGGRANVALSVIIGSLSCEKRNSRIPREITLVGRCQADVA
jgi:hypothetical protein